MTPTSTSASQPLDLSKWRKAPTILIVAGILFIGIGLIVSGAGRGKQFGYSWLLAFMFFLSLCLGSLFLVIVHHLFDAGWSVAIRRFCEHIATMLYHVMPLLFIPIAFLATTIYPWMAELKEGHINHSLAAKQPLFSVPMFYVVAAICFGVWFILANRLRYWSLRQDETVDPKCTHRMRFYAAWGIFAFAITLTIAAVMWMKGLMYEWFSTMYGVYYFAGSVWLALATAYLITMVLDRQGVLSDVLHEHQYYFIGSLLFAFTVFYAYIHFAQYFIIWNGNMPEETFWYVVREKGSWWCIGMIIIFGHFFVPFLGLLRIDVKHVFPYMTALCVWAWLMHFIDLSFNIMPVLHPNGFVLHWMDIGCWCFMAGVVAKVFLIKYANHPPYPVKDPRLIEAMGFFHPVPTQISGGELDQTDDLRDAPPQARGGFK